MTVELIECALVRPSLGVIAKGPILAAAGRKAVGALLGPVEALVGDRLAIIAIGREPSVWALETAFVLGNGRGTFPQAALIYFPLDTVELWSVDQSLAKYRSRQLDYEAGASQPTVRVVLP